MNADIEAEKKASLTAVQLLNTLCGMLQRLQVIEEVLLTLISNQDVQNEFLTEQILRARLNMQKYSNKTPFKRLDELETLLKGYIAYQQEKEAERYAQRIAKQKGPIL